MARREDIPLRSTPVNPTNVKLVKVSDEHLSLVPEKSNKEGVHEPTLCKHGEGGN